MGHGWRLITACQRDVSNPADLGNGYVSFVDELLTACYPSYQIPVLNRGVPGDTVRELKARWQIDVLDLQPDWLSVCIGINDVWQQFEGNQAGLLLVLGAVPAPVYRWAEAAGRQLMP